jgi:hypothetical protein
MSLLVTLSVNIIVLAFFFIIITKRFNKKYDAKALLDAVQKEVDGIIVELNGTTDRNIALLEDRIKTLSEILKKTDKKIEYLKKESKRQVYIDDRYNDILKSNITGNGEKPDEPAKERIRELYRQGISAHLIAKKTGISQGEVDLYISLIENK